MNTEYEYALGQNIRTLRLKRGLSQEQLAAQLQTRGCDITRSALRPAPHLPRRAETSP